MQRWIEFLPEARALLVTVILSARAVRVIRTLCLGAPTSTIKSDAVAPIPTSSASTTGVVERNTARSNLPPGSRTWCVSCGSRSPRRPRSP